MKKCLPCLILLLPILAACSNVRSKQPVGKNPVNLSVQADQIAWQSIAGDWVNADGEVTQVKIVDGKKGLVHFQGAGEDDQPQPVTFRQTGDTFFLNFTDQEGVGEYHWMMLKANNEMTELIFWDPDTEKFRELIAEKKIKGVNDPLEKRNEQGQLVKHYTPGALIDDPTGSWVTDMIAGKFGVLVDWKNPTVLRKKVGY
ncbi:hypothetical protein NT6N_11850 [Oceaniferula spumae]|uniref:Lipoprotein n=1 Tax=Oceaniferula spumae TaxID=2979115 RepID=A0AAT9FJG3_9BACT